MSRRSRGRSRDDGYSSDRSSLSSSESSNEDEENGHHRHKHHTRLLDSLDTSIPALQNRELRSPSSSSEGEKEKQHRENKKRKRQVSDSPERRKAPKIRSQVKKAKKPIRYFIMKSYSLANLEISIKNGIWATQPKNERKLNHAYSNADVILIYSVNNSRHFQGYGRMASRIGDKRSDVWDRYSTRGKQPWAHSFRIQWLRLYELSFERTAHLRNPLNENKPVKISRDGQELPPDVGVALCAMLDKGASEEAERKKKEGKKREPDNPRERSREERYRHRDSPRSRERRSSSQRDHFTSSSPSTFRDRREDRGRDRYDWQPPRYRRSYSPPPPYSHTPPPYPPYHHPWPGSFGFMGGPVNVPFGNYGRGPYPPPPPHHYDFPPRERVVYKSHARDSRNSRRNDRTRRGHHRY